VTGADGQLSLFHGYRPEALQTVECSVEGCHVLHGGNGPCIRCRTDSRRTDNRRSDLADRLEALAALVDKGVPIEEIEPFADAVLAGIDRRWRVLKGDSLAERFRVLAAELESTGT
jgi:hypothetical protein